MGKWTYSDGTEVTIRDVALSVKRMLLHRPNFPVLRYIVGKQDWIMLKEPLKNEIPGIEISGETLTIKLSQKVYQPLFRLSLNIFSVIPEKCVNLSNNKLACTHPPSSGYYVQESAFEKKILFKLRKNLPNNIAQKLPQQILFDYENRPIEEYFSGEKTDTVVWGYDLNFTPQEHHMLSTKYRVERLPSAWFTGFVLNPRVDPFSDADCRYWFAQEFRNIFSHQELDPIVASSSIFTKLIPGYKSNSSLTSLRKPGNSGAQERCISALKKSGLVYAIRTQTTPPLVEKTLKTMSEKHGFNISEPVIAPSSHSGWPTYGRTDVAFQLSNSGFWPLDPVGDIQMLFSGIHEDYMDIQSDKVIQSLVRDISQSYSFEEINNNMSRLNQSLFNSAYFNIFCNQSYFYVSRSDCSTRKCLELSVTLPYPWQVF